jgi:hypothetical protein
MSVNKRYRSRGSQSDVGYLDWPISPSLYESKCGGWVGFRGLSQWEQLYTGAQINCGDLTSYVTYGKKVGLVWEAGKPWIALTGIGTGAQINCGDLTPYLTYVKKVGLFSSLVWEAGKPWIALTGIGRHLVKPFSGFQPDWLSAVLYTREGLIDFAPSPEAKPFLKNIHN